MLRRLLALAAGMAVCSGSWHSGVRVLGPRRAPFPARHCTPLAAEVPAAAPLLDALEGFLRSQTIESVLPRDDAKALLSDLRDDRRFWAQQRKQFAVV